MLSGDVIPPRWGWRVMNATFPRAMHWAMTFGAFGAEKSNSVFQHPAFGAEENNSVFVHPAFGAEESVSTSRLWRGRMSPTDVDRQVKLIIN